MLRTIAVLFGIIFIVVGVAGFIPSLIKDGLLFGYFTPSSMHNLVHIVTGVIAIMAATNYASTRLFFKVFGIVYLLIGIIGFVRGGDLFIMQLNNADNTFHIIVGLVAIYFGFLLNRV